MSMKLFFALLMLLAPVFFVSAHEEYNTIIIEINDETGFVPSELTISEGDTVLFRSAGADLHWPASNIHPTHQIYPEFDPKRALEPHEEWSFVFEKAGVWRMHDHVRPEFAGVIIVEEDPDYMSAENPFLVSGDAMYGLYEKITQIFKRIYAYTFPWRIEAGFEALDIFTVVRGEKDLTRWMDLMGPEKIMDRLISASGGGSLFDCHTEAHYTGRAAYDVYGSEAFKRGDASCHSGYYHGAMEGFLQDRGTDAIAEKINSLCLLFDTSFGVFECLHGVGHGVMVYEDYDMPNALATCKQLATPFDQNSCYGGVFMENIVAGQGNGAISGHDTEWISYGDPYYPCNAVDQSQDVQIQCYQMQTSWMLTIKNYDFDAVAKDCLGAPKDMVPVCFLSLGRDAAGFTLRDPAAIKDLCAKVPEEYSGQCVTGATNVIVDFWGAGLTRQASDLCTILGGNDKNTCWGILSGRLLDVFGDPVQRKAICDTFEPSFRYLCDSF